MRVAGIYVHIPFCKSRCKYCDFFSTTMLERREEYVQALLREMQQRKDYLHCENIHTVYLGGGTPSMLTSEQIGTVLEGLRSEFAIDADAEITLEANPSDITPSVLADWRRMGFNRLSIGVQSFDDEMLRKIGRRHNGEQAKKAVREAQEAGFRNISIDLIYGLPEQTMEEWKGEIEQALALDIQHVSAYCLSYEEGTELTRQLRNKEIKEVDEETENAMYDYLTETLEKHGLLRYEVSNFALAGFESQHNSSYWNGTPYLGLGAGAHSYDTESRQWNVGNLEEYIKGVTEGDVYFEREALTKDDRYNEYIMLKIRTRDGLFLSKVARPLQDRCKKVAKTYIQNGQLKVVHPAGFQSNGNATDEIDSETRLVATQEGIHILNRIIEDLMI